MTDAWDGRPENPERDGRHWVHHKEDLRPIPAMWNAALAGWTCGTLHSPSGIVGLGYTYLGPALLPAEVAAREAAAAAEEREACALIADATTGPVGPMPEALNKHAKETLARATVMATKREIAAAIRARGKETEA